MSKSHDGGGGKGRFPEAIKGFNTFTQSCRWRSDGIANWISSSIATLDES
jgi:hypothetical protein